MKISIIIPVYNGEKYIRQAVYSVLNQPYKNIEVIAINDGSLDHSEKILKDIIESDMRLHIVCQENQGVASARNQGIRMATGDYIAFLDQDDIWVPDFLTDDVIQKIEKNSCEMISFAYFQSNQNITRVLLHPREEKVITEPLKHGGENYRHHSSYFYFKKFILDNNILIDKHRHEDERFRMQCIYNAKKILYLKKPIFIYRNNNSSVSHQNIQKKEKAIIDCMEGYKELEEKVSDKKIITQYCIDTRLHLLLELLSVIATCKKKFYEKDYRFDELWMNHGWMSEKDIKSWNLYLTHKNLFVIKNRIRQIISQILKQFQRIKFLQNIYEKKKYPLKWEQVTEYEKDKNTIFNP